MIVGLACIRVSSNSYRSSFSTILRTTRNEQLDVLVPRGETSGAEPLSKVLAETNLSFQCHIITHDTNSSLTDMTSAAFMVVKAKEPAYEQLAQIQDDCTT